jgi:hypothetical protein
MLGQATVIPGGERISVPAPIDELPLFVRAGALLPLLSPDVATLADYGSASAGTVRLADRADQFYLIAFPRGSSAAEALRGDRMISTEGTHGWELRLRNRRERTWHIQASLATLTAPFTPCSVELDGQPLPASDWSFDSPSQVLRAVIRARTGRLLVRRCS